MKPIQERIRTAYIQLRPERGGDRDYAAMLRAVFPEADYPRAFTYAAQGGPPGCAIAFGKAIRQLGGRIIHRPKQATVVRLPPGHRRSASA